MHHSGLAQRRAAQQRAERPLDRKMDRLQIRCAMQRRPHHDWSPDQIAGRLRDDSAERSVDLDLCIDDQQLD